MSGLACQQMGFRGALNVSLEAPFIDFGGFVQFNSTVFGDGTGIARIQELREQRDECTQIVNLKCTFAGKVHK